MVRDKDGFCLLVPRTGRSYGEHRLLANDIGSSSILKKSSRYRIRVGSADTPELVTGYAPKTWQHKAWRLIGSDIDWSTKSAFGTIRVKDKTCKLCHIKRIGVSIKVLGNSVSSKRGVVIDQIISTNNSHGMYAVADNPKEFRVLFDRYYKMLYKNVDAYIDIASKMKLTEIYYVSKALIVYDDKSFDALSGDPRFIQQHLGIEFTKEGRVRI